MKTAVVSAAFGRHYEWMSSVTWPNQRAYAEKIGSDFLTLKEQRNPQAMPTWEKLQLKDLFADYERLLWLDCDVAVRDDCPDLFGVVPESKIGAWDESAVGPWDYPGFIKKWSDLADQGDVPYPGWHFNCGVMVLSRAQVKIFEDPPIYTGYELLWDQGWFNFGVAREGIHLLDLGWKFNHTFLAPGDRLDSFVIHYCGTVNGSGFAKDLEPGEHCADLIARDLAAWKKGGRADGRPSRKVPS